MLYTEGPAGLGHVTRMEDFIGPYSRAKPRDRELTKGPTGHSKPAKAKDPVDMDCKVHLPGPGKELLAGATRVVRCFMPLLVAAAAPRRRRAAETLSQLPARVRPMGGARCLLDLDGLPGRKMLGTAWARLLEPPPRCGPARVTRWGPGAAAPPWRME